MMRQQPDWISTAGPGTHRASRARAKVASLVAGVFLLDVLLADHSAAAADPLPIQTSVQLDWSQPTRVYTVDLGTLPTRPWLVIEVTADPGHSSMALSVQATNWQFQSSHPGYACFTPSNIFSNSGLGTVSLSASLVNCDPTPGALVGETVQVFINAVDFGLAGAPATVSIVVRGETRPPTGTLIQQVVPPNMARQISLPASKDTVLYADDGSASNGEGPFLWAGDGLSGSFPFFLHYPRRALVAFDVNNSIAPVANVLDASLRLRVTSTFHTGEPLRVQSVAPGQFGSWAEGDAFALGDGFFGASSLAPAADWFYRARPFETWTTPGADVAGPPLAEGPVYSEGNVIFSTSGLHNAVQDMITNGGAEHGFLLSSPNPALFPYPIQLASREHPVAEYRPELIISYSLPEVYESGNVTTGVVNFINEGQNFRWIYDLDHDDVFVTNIGGVCEVVTQTNPPRVVPYVYRYQGTPYTGVDCCTWRVDSPQTGTVGTGQALFFHNLDASNPANMPADSDLDGIRNLCDNCPSTPNGPLRGTCLIGTIGALCHSNQECGTGGVCNLSQEDSNGDFVGNVCVPEPRSAAGLAAGLSLIAAWSRRRARALLRSRSRNHVRRTRNGRRPHAMRSMLGVCWFGLALLGDGSAQAADPLPILASNVLLGSTTTVRTYTIDLGTLPTRPALVVLVYPDAAHSDMQLQVEATNWLNVPPSGPGACPTPTASSVSTSGPGVLEFVSFTVQNCDPHPDAFDGATVDIRIRALHSARRAGRPRSRSKSVARRGRRRAP